jgi:hypothetical protein
LGCAGLVRLGFWWATPRQVSPGKAPFLFLFYLFSVLNFLFQFCF